MNKVIKNPAEYELALRRLNDLLDCDAQPETEQGEEVELLALLISDFEKREFERLPPPTAIEAIRFRMEQLGLAQKDLISYLGSRSRVSEVLSGKRPLTVSMIRSLSEGLHIPAEVLLNDGSPSSDDDAELPWGDFPIAEMIRRRWIDAADDVVESVRQFVQPALAFATAFRRTTHFRSTRNVDHLAMLAWVAAVTRTASDKAKYMEPYEPLDDETLREVVRLSWFDRGPLLAVEFLQKHGIPIVIEPPLPRTFLDGATVFLSDRPVVALTLRFDRLDSFWYTLTHELVHVTRHKHFASIFIDDMETGVSDPIESEADDVAAEILIPAEAWRVSPASRLRSPQAAEHLAKKLHISPAIVAGKIRRQYGDYRVLSSLVGQNAVRRLFEDQEWQEG